MTMSKRTTSHSGGIAKVLIVDDHPSVREGLALRISRQPGLKVCGEAANVADALALIATTHPDVAVIDISLKDGNGIDLIKRIKSRGDPVRMLVCSMHSDALYAERAIRAGALGYISKEHATDKIIEAIQRVLDGKLYVSEHVAETLLHHALVGESQPAGHSPVELLSDRELEAFGLLGQGLDTHQIAARMHVSPKTIETYRVRIKEKLHVTSVPELIRRAVEWSLESKVS
ncbi:MAG: response regulator transcription factor [Planctomycetales bacterium]|nr:response regulator transcription factor [Planctomycetales bacterium]